MLLSCFVLDIDEMQAYRKTIWHRLRFLNRPLLWLYTLLAIVCVLLVVSFIPELSPTAKDFFKRHRALRYLAD